ncbi:MAG: M20/M25/M40 family metallo-hydrolase [Candidatus Cloacimonetes bacterium]|nr:M20/M25/M40 family metallo-hydrolase [Candidatus Cloacimonadota bacterium]
MDNTIIEYFLSLIKIDSESKNEKAVAEKLEKDLKELGAEVLFDKAQLKTGGNVGNLYAYIPGSINKPPILFCAHMDTVKPGNGINPQIKDGLITSDGTTILGADDKSGITEIIWAIKELKESGEKHAPVEILFTISEEIGLKGAKHLDYSLIRSKTGYALDSHQVGRLSIGAPSQNSLKFVVRGKESHAGVAPEKGINAIRVAAEAIAAMPDGRIDSETTCNVGIIKGGKATNVVPNEVIIEAEARSHNKDKLKKVSDEMCQAFREVVKKFQVGKYKAEVEIKVKEEYQAFRLNEKAEVVVLAKDAAEKLDIEFKTEIGGGGSDVNIFNQHGLLMAVAGSGMDKVHTVDECIKISELEIGAKWMLEIIREYSK